MKYAVIHRCITDATWMIRFLDSGDTEILSRNNENFQFSEEEKATIFEHEDVSYFWERWASAKLWKEVWIDDSQGNGDDTTINYFDYFDQAFNFLNK